VISGAIKNPYVVVVAVLAIAVIGYASYDRIPADLLPVYDTPAVQIVTFYPGMPPEVMERDIMSRLERWTGQSVGIEHQEGKAMLGVSVVKDFFREDISLDTAMSQVTSYAVSDMFYLPPGTIPPMVMPFDPTASIPLCLVSVSSPTMSEKELYDVAYYELRNRLQSIQGVIAPAVYGGTLRRILAYVDNEQLQARGLSPMDVVRSVQDFNVLIPAGNAKMGDLDYQIFTNAMPQEVEEINDFPIRWDDVNPVFLRDVAEAKDSHQIQSNIVRVNGRRQVYIPIYRQPGANTIEIVDNIRTQLKGILQRLRDMDDRADDLALEVVMDQSVYVRTNVDGLKTAAFLGAGLAGLIVLLFLGSIRASIVVWIAIPLSILASLIVLFATGNTINAMTLGGLALAIGILVDQSIVVLDNVLRHQQLGLEPREAAKVGTQEVAKPVLVSTITFCVVFFPVVYLSGMAKYLFTPLAVSATACIVASYFLAITLTPAYCARFVRLRRRKQGKDGTPSSGGEAFRSFVRRVIQLRYVVIALVTLAGVGAWFLLQNTGTELFPRVDANQAKILVRLPSGTRIEKTEETIEKIESIIMEELGQPDPEYPNVEKHPDSNLRILISNIGVLMDWPAAYTPNTGPMDAFILIQLKGKEGMGTTLEAMQKIRKRLHSDVPIAEVAFDTGGMLTAALNFGEPAPIHLQVSGSKLEDSRTIAERIVANIEQVEGVVDTRIAQRLDYPLIEFEFDRTRAAWANVSMQDVAKNLVTATNSSVNFDPAFWIDERNGNHYFIGAQYPENRINDLDTIRNIPVTKDSSSEPVLLRDLGTIRRGTGPSVINHHNITRVIDIYANVEGRDIGSTVTEIEQRLMRDPELKAARKQGPRGEFFSVTGGQFQGKGYRFNLTGEIQTMRKSISQFSTGLLIAIILVYLVMVAQFRSFLDPLIILLTIPLGFIGIAVILWATQTNLSIQTFMGIVMTVGIVVQYGILLVEFANQGLERGLSVVEAVVEATAIRLRPILMTSLTTILALMPMAFGIGGGEANIPLSRAIIGGVLGAMILSLVVVPSLYVLFKRAPKHTDTESEQTQVMGESHGQPA
jgi:multidrug efflux pump subunit AcrB